jgi:DNA-binding response OmpR family regulator
MVQGATHSGRDVGAVTGGRVLVVDDDALLRASVGRVLEEEGYIVDHAADGNEALRRLADARPDLVLLDVLMPGMNGRQLIESLRNDADTRELPVLVMTAVHGIDSNAGISEGAIDYVEKPFDLDELLNKVALALYRTGRPRAEVASPRTSRLGTHVGGTDESPDPIVLVVDDDRKVLTAFDQFLSDLGYTVVSMSRVTEDLPRLARVLEPRAVLLDLHLPGTDGMTALRWLRADASLDDIPILVFTGDPCQAESCRPEVEALCADVALKPQAIDQVSDFLAAPPARARRRSLAT